MTSEGLGEVFKGDSADACAEKFPLMSMGGWANGQSCADGERGPPSPRAEKYILISCWELYEEVEPSGVLSFVICAEYFYLTQPDCLRTTIGVCVCIFAVLIGGGWHYSMCSKFKIIMIGSKWKHSYLFITIFYISYIYLPWYET